MRVAGKWPKAAGIVVAAMLLLHTTVVVKSLLHLRAGGGLEEQGQALAAAREYQAAMGYHAPLNPWCGAAAVRLADLARSVESTDPELASDLEDRLRRSLVGTRSFYQPHRDLLAESPRPADPNLVLFLAALLGLVVGIGVWWWPRRTAPGRRLVASLVGLAVWALLLHLC